MEIRKSTSLQEITQVSVEEIQKTCKLSWKIAQGGLIICATSAIRDYPSIDVLKKLTESQENELFTKESLNFTAADGNLYRLFYVSERSIQASGGSYQFAFGDAFKPPIRIQLWCVDEAKRIAYEPNMNLNRCILKATVHVTLKRPWWMKLLFFLKGRVVKIRMPGIKDFKDDILCYTVENAPEDVNGDPYKYPIPNSKYGKKFRLPIRNFILEIDDKWKDCIKLDIVQE